MAIQNVLECGQRLSYFGRYLAGRQTVLQDRGPTTGFPEPCSCCSWLLPSKLLLLQDFRPKELWCNNPTDLANYGLQAAVEIRHGSVYTSQVRSLWHHLIHVQDTL